MKNLGMSALLILGLSQLTGCGSKLDFLSKGSSSVQAVSPSTQILSSDASLIGGYSYQSNGLNFTVKIDDPTAVTSPGSGDGMTTSSNLNSLNSSGLAISNVARVASLSESSLRILVQADCAAGSSLQYSSQTTSTSGISGSIAISTNFFENAMSPCNQVEAAVALLLQADTFDVNESTLILKSSISANYSVSLKRID